MIRRRSARQRQVFAAATRSLGERIGRGGPVRDEFFAVTGPDGSVRHPMAELMSSRSTSGGGRGGQTRVALYLSALWIGVAGDHSTTRPASFWASLLGLEDPDGRGARVIRSTWAELEARQYVRVHPGAHAGDIPTIYPLREDGSGVPYTRPDGQGVDTYRRIPEKFWEMLLPDGELTSPGQVMYLVAIRTALVVQRSTGLTFPRAYVTKTFGIGESTRKAGLRNLTDLLVLDPHKRLVDDDGDLLARRRQRTVYDVLAPFDPPAPPPPEPARSSSEPRRTRETPAAAPGRPLGSEWLPPGPFDTPF
jgi:hypothetical protein